MLPDLTISMSETALWLTQEEAFALLEMCTFTLAKETPTHLLALDRLGHLCREMLSMPTTEQISLDDCLPLASPNGPGEQRTVVCSY